MSPRRQVLLPSIWIYSICFLDRQERTTPAIFSWWYKLLFQRISQWQNGVSLRQCPRSRINSRCGQNWEHGKFSQFFTFLKTKYLKYQKMQDLLPMVTFHYGKVHLQKPQNASVLIGPLICQGSKPRPIPKSCLEVKLQGRPSGYYLFPATTILLNMIRTCYDKKSLASGWWPR